MRAMSAEFHAETPVTVHGGCGDSPRRGGGQQGEARALEGRGPVRRRELWPDMDMRPHRQAPTARAGPASQGRLHRGTQCSGASRREPAHLVLHPTEPQKYNKMSGQLWKLLDHLLFKAGLLSPRAVDQYCLAHNMHR